MTDALVRMTTVVRYLAPMEEEYVPMVHCCVVLQRNLCVTCSSIKPESLPYDVTSPRVSRSNTQTEGEESRIPSLLLGMAGLGMIMVEMPSRGLCILPSNGRYPNIHTVENIHLAALIGSSILGLLSSYVMWETWTRYSECSFQDRDNTKFGSSLPQFRNGDYNCIGELMDVGSKDTIVEPAATNTM